MGLALSIVGIQREEEPACAVVLDRTAIYRKRKRAGVVPYEIRRYGTRYAIEAAFDDPSAPPPSAGDENGSNGRRDDGTRSPFLKLAGYIGVLSEAQNEGGEGIAMTAPVAMRGGSSGGSSGSSGSEDQKSNKKKDQKKKGEKIAMTAPVAMHREGDTSEAGAAAATGGRRTIRFFLPSKYDSLEKIPAPTHPGVTVRTVPPAVGAVHCYSGTFAEDTSRGRARALVETLRKDGAEVDINAALNGYEFWGYNPPFTIPALRRNEVWVELSEEQVEKLTTMYGGEEENAEMEQDRLSD